MDKGRKVWVNIYFVGGDSVAVSGESFNRECHRNVDFWILDKVEIESIPQGFDNDYQPITRAFVKNKVQVSVKKITYTEVIEANE